MKREKYLPIGSVVLLKDAKKRVMITGFVVKANKDEEKYFDYVGCVYPEGMISSKQILFNHEQIDKLFYIGFADLEEQMFKEKLNEIVKKIDNHEELENN